MRDPIVIKNWQEGIADSPYTGLFAHMQNVDIYSIPGVLQTALMGTKESGTTIASLPTWFTIDPSTGKVYTVDDTNKVYERSTSGSWSEITTQNATTRTTTSGAGNGLIYWHNALLAFRNAAIDVLYPLDNTGTRTWTNAWQTITSDSKYHPALVGQDDICYWGSDRYIGGVEDLSTFNPGTPGTYTFTDNRLDLPKNYRIKSIEELGQYLLIGTWQGSNIYDVKIADIFPWDRSSDSFDIPLRLRLNGITQLININNLVYIGAGTQHEIYVTNSSSVQKFRKIPEAIHDFQTTANVYLDPFPGAIMEHKGRLFYGVSGGTGGTGILVPKGVWSLNGDKLLFEAQVSAGSISQIKIGCLISISNEIFLVGWQDSLNSTQGVDEFGKNGYRINDSTYAISYVDTQFMRVSDKIGPRTFNTYTLELEQPLANSTEGVRISYRTARNASFTTIATLTGSGTQSFSGPANIPNAENLQIRIALTAAATSTSSPRVIELKLE